MLISYDSEMKLENNREQDPVKRVFFYSRKTPWEAKLGASLFKDKSNDVQPSSKRSNLVIPKTFVSRKIRLYASRDKSKEELDKLKQ